MVDGQDDLKIAKPDMHTLLGCIFVHRTVKDPVPASVDDPGSGRYGGV